MSNKGFIPIIVAIFIFLAGLILIARYGLPRAGDNSIFSSATPPTTAVTAIPECEIVSDPKAVFESFEREYLKKGEGDTQDLADVDYKLIRKNVPFDVKTMFEFEDEKDHHKHAYKIGVKNIEGKDYEMYYPGYSGEVLISQAIRSPSRGNDIEKLYFIDWGLVFLVHLNNGVIEEITSNGKNYYMTDVYQNTSKGGIPDEAFSCPDVINSTTPLEVVVPSQSPSADKKQLQLQYFSFNQEEIPGFVSNVLCKPAVYLYPESKEFVNVKVFPKGSLTYTDPLYDSKEGWTVMAYPDGKIEYPISNIKYPISNYDYLYYEAKIRDSEIKKPESGFVIEYSKLLPFYAHILPKLGLNEGQTQDFIDYWQKALPYSPYYFVGVLDQEQVNRIEPLEITPRPDFINRVRLYFEAMEKPVEVKEPVINNYELLTTNYQLRVVDWGGMVKMDKEHPFTCSQ